MISELDLKVLWSIADDFEEIPQIKSGLKINAATDLPAQDIARSLHRLVALQLANAYQFDESKQEYVEVTFSCEDANWEFADRTWRPMEPTGSRRWFYITTAGSDFLAGQDSPFH